VCNKFYFVSVMYNCLDQASSQNASHSSAERVRPPDDLQHIGKYRFIKTIGRGNFAKVKLAKHVPTGRQVMQMKCRILLVS